MSAQEDEAVVLYHDTCHHHIYRLTCEEFDALWDRSRGCCEICGVRETETKRGRLSIDHDQRSIHLVRGLLCDMCNAGVMRRVDEGRPSYATPATDRYAAEPWVPFGTPLPPPVNIKTTRAFRGRSAAPKPVGATPIRTVRIDGEVWDQAQAKAKRRRETVAAVIRRALLEYVEED